MRFGGLRHKILFVKPCGDKINDMGEKVITFSLYHPNLPPQLLYRKQDLWVDENGNKLNTSINPYCISANVLPNTGRKYIESQKLRAETTYSVTTRYIPNVKQDMFIIYNNKTLFIQSVIEQGVTCKELNIVCWEVSNSGT